MAFDPLDDWFGINPSPVYPDQSAVLAQQAAVQAEQQRVAKEAADKAALAKARSDAEATARTGASSYFTERGLDPTQYQSDIDQKIAEMMGTISPDDPTPGGSLLGIGESVYQTAQDAARERAQRGLSSALPTDFEYGRIGSTLDDPFLADINQQERTKADTFLQNLLKRGVINQTGYQGGEANVDEQSARARTLLDSLGGDVLAGGRSSLKDIADRARTRASTLNLGENFDPSSYETDIGNQYDEFLKSLPDKLRAVTPGNLYDTSGLSAIAGAAQGGQNLKFDPNALAGILSSDAEEKKKQDEQAQQGPMSRGVF